MNGKKMQIVRDLSFEDEPDECRYNFCSWIEWILFYRIVNLGMIVGF